MWDLDHEMGLSLSAPTFCEWMNVATVFLYISSVPKVERKMRHLFLPPSTGTMCFPSKRTLVELWAFMCSGIFIFIFFFVLLCQNQRKYVREVGIKNNYLLC